MALAISKDAAVPPPHPAEFRRRDIDVAVARRVLEVSRSAYYDWLSRLAFLRSQENELLLKHTIGFTPIPGKRMIHRGSTPS